MKRFLVLLILFSLTSQTIKAKPQLDVLLLAGEWAPYTTRNTPDKGFFTALVTASFQAVKISPKYKFFPWKRAELGVHSGEAFAAFPYAPVGERLKKFNFSKKITISANPPRIFYYKPHDTEYRYTTIDSLKKYRLLSYLGYFTTEIFTQKGIKFDQAPSEILAMKMLHAGRGELFPNDPESGWQIIHKYFPNEVHNFGVLKKPFPGTGLYLMVSKKYPNAQQILKQFHRGFRIILQNGTYQKILKNHDKEKYSILTTP